MKVYRIKHKPSGLYWDSNSQKLTKYGTVYDLPAHADIGLIWVREKYHRQYHHSDFELKEYNLED